MYAFGTNLDSKDVQFRADWKQNQKDVTTTLRVHRYGGDVTDQVGLYLPDADSNSLIIVSVIHLPTAQKIGSTQFRVVTVTGVPIMHRASTDRDLKWMYIDGENFSRNAVISFEVAPNDWRPVPTTVYSLKQVGCALPAGKPMKYRVCNPTGESGHTPGVASGVSVSMTPTATTTMAPAPAARPVDVVKLAPKRTIHGLLVLVLLAWKLCQYVRKSDGANAQKLVAWWKYVISTYSNVLSSRFVRLCPDPMRRAWTIGRRRTRMATKRKMRPRKRIGWRHSPLYGVTTRRDDTEVRIR